MKHIATTGLLSAALVLGGCVDAINYVENAPSSQQEKMLRLVFAEASTRNIEALNSKYPLILPLYAAPDVRMIVSTGHVQTCHAELGYGSIDPVTEDDDKFDAWQAAACLKLATLRPYIVSTKTVDDALKTNIFQPAVALHIPACTQDIIPGDGTPTLPQTEQIYNCALDKAVSMTGEGYTMSSIHLKP